MLKDAPQQPLARLLQGIDSALRRDSAVILGFRWEPEKTDRHMGVELNDAHAEEVAWVLARLALHAQEIERRLEHWDHLVLRGEAYRLDQNSDGGVKVVIGDDGDIELQGTRHHDNGSTERASYTLTETFRRIRE